MARTPSHLISKIQPFPVKQVFDQTGQHWGKWHQIGSRLRIALEIHPELCPDLESCLPATRSWNSLGQKSHRSILRRCKPNRVHLPRWLYLVVLGLKPIRSEPASETVPI